MTVLMHEYIKLLVVTFPKKIAAKIECFSD